MGAAPFWRYQIYLFTALLAAIVRRLKCPELECPILTFEVKNGTPGSCQVCDNAWGLERWPLASISRVHGYSHRGCTRRTRRHMSLRRALSLFEQALYIFRLTGLAKSEIPQKSRRLWTHASLCLLHTIVGCSR